MKVRVVHGSNAKKYDVAGKTVGYVRKCLRDIFNIGTDAVAWVNGLEVSGNHVLEANDNLEFGRYTGQKGGVPDFVSENEVRQMYGDDGFERLKNAGLKSSMQPVFNGLEVTGFGSSLNNNAVPLKPLPISVDVEAETVTFNDTTCECDRSITLVLKCLMDARGEIRSTGDIKRAFPDEPWEERLDLTIKRKLMYHKSGVGSLVESVNKRGYRLRIEACE